MIVLFHRNQIFPALFLLNLIVLVTPIPAPNVTANHIATQTVTGPDRSLRLIFVVPLMVEEGISREMSSLMAQLPRCWNPAVVAPTVVVIE